ncbi:MAG: M10 family metallopeptidase C-terminal domain-containing protein [Planctomycetota bacterium]|nr:M10 family metallopeptidase C-terminal domain-containing protein [Planctomycetota bacterium]
MANLNPPEVHGIDNIVKIGESVPVSSFFTVFDPDGNEIVEYSFMDSSDAPDSGYLTLNGVQLEAGVFHTIDAEELANLRYFAGSVVGEEKIRIRANDGLYNSNTAIANAFSARENTTRPVFDANNRTSVSHEFVQVASMYDGYDPDGWPTVRYKFRDKNAKSNSGYFILDGVRMASNSWFYVKVEDFDKLEYYTGTGRTQENLLGRMYDGEKWSRVARSKFITTRNENRPVINAQYLAKGAGEAFPMSELFSVSDADGNTPKWYEFRDSSSQSDSGFMTLNGLVQPALTWITVSADELENCTYTTGSVNRLDNIVIRVNDGKFLSTTERAYVAVSSRPVVEPKPPFVFDGDEVVDLVSIVDQSDDGPRNVRYRLYDDSINPFSLRFELNGDLLWPKQVHTIDAATMQEMQVRTGDFNTRRLDELYVQTYNGSKWSVWRSLKVWTEPRVLDAMANVEDTVIANRNSWRMWLNGSPDEPLTITYSFREINTPGFDLYTRRFTNTERIRTRNILEDLEGKINVNFQEISDNFFDPVTGNQGGILRISHGLIDWAGAPDNAASAPWGGNIYLNDLHFMEQMAVGTLSHSTFLSLLGTAMGLRPAASTEQYFDPLLFKWPLPTDSDDHRHTVMSTNYNPDNVALDPDGLEVVIPNEPIRYGIYDMHALLHLYDGAEDAMAGDTVYGNTGNPTDLDDWTAKIIVPIDEDGDGIFESEEQHDKAFQTTISGDSAGTDTIDVSEMFVSSVIDLTPGSYSSIGESTLDGVTFIPSTNNVAIGHDTIIENVIGGVSDEIIRGNFADNVLIGNEGNDILIGGGGSDRLVGGPGSDTYRWKLTDQNEEIDENLSGGDDILELNAHWGMNHLHDDMQFWREGSDLCIDLTLNDSLSQGEIRIKDMQFGLSRVEILRLNYYDGETEDVDLQSIFNGASNTAQYFQVTGDSTDYGLIATPV